MAQPKRWITDLQGRRERLLEQMRFVGVPMSATYIAIRCSYQGSRRAANAQCRRDLVALEALGLVRRVKLAGYPMLWEAVGHTRGTTP
jgi:hypothetical protein